MNKKNILVLSDVHYGEFAHMDTFGKSGIPSNEDFLAIAHGIVEGLDQQIDFLFVLGDLTSRGSPGEFQDFYNFLSILRDLLNLDESQVYITYGNHDVDWSVCQIKLEPTGHHKAYCVTAANIGGFFAPPGDYTVCGPVVGCGIAHLDGIDLISLNSGIECYEDQAIKHGRLGSSQFSWLKNKLPGHLRPDTTKIVILHHHLLTLPYSIPVHDLSALEEGSNVLDILGDCGIDIVLHGHRHHPIVHTASNSRWKKPITFFCAGSFGVSANERASGRLPNTFHTVNINSYSGEQTLEGFIKSFELNSASEWIPLIDNNNEYPLNQTHWFGAPDAMQKAKDEVKSIIEKSASELASSSFSCLPEYDSLPLSLRCIFHASLNKIFEDESVGAGLQITGEYPKQCMATRAV